MNMKTTIAHLRAELYRRGRFMRFIIMPIAMVFIVSVPLIKQATGVFHTPVFIFGIILVVFALVGIMLNQSTAPVRLRIDKLRRADYLRATPDFMDEWVTFDSSYNWFGRDYYRLVYSGVHPSDAIRWVHTKYLICHKPITPLLTVNAKDFVDIIDYTEAGIGYEDFYRLWNLGINSVDAMTSVVHHDLDVELVRSLVG